jgi:hypothetical protein
MAVCIYLELLITNLMCLLGFNSFERVALSCLCQIKFQISAQGRCLGTRNMKAKMINDNGHYLC